MALNAHVKIESKIMRNDNSMGGPATLRIAYAAYFPLGILV